MAKSFVTYDGDGTTKVFTVPFGYLNPEHVVALVNKIEVPATMTGPSEITLTDAPLGGTQVRIRRFTPTDPQVAFDYRNSNKGVLLNLMYQHALYVAEEGVDLEAINKEDDDFGGVPLMANRNLSDVSDKPLAMAQLGVTDALALKANQTALDATNATVATKANQTALTAGLAGKSDVGHSHTAADTAFTPVVDIPGPTTQDAIEQVQANLVAVSIGDVPAAASWAYQPVGVPIPMFTHLAGVSPPPTDKSYRYIKLSSSDPYNTGVLNSENVTGSSPNIMATAVISDALSPLNGQTVRLINTEARFIRPGVTAGVLEEDQNAAHTHTGSANSNGSHSHTGSANSAGFHTHNLNGIGTADNTETTGSNNRWRDGATSRETTGSGIHTHTLSINNNGDHTHTLSVDSSGGSEARPRNIRAVYFMRIR